MNLNAVDTKISVAGKPCDYTTMSLHQRMAGHHTFEIAVNYRFKEQSVWAVTVDDIFNEMLEKPVSIQMKHRETGETNDFVGVVTDIKVVGVHGDQGTVILKGGSPTILMDRNPDMDAFMDYTLSNVVAETVGKTAVKISLQNQPKFGGIIPYIERYRETSWAFLSRISAAYGEWCYYDGNKLIVGNPMNQQGKKVTYAMELLEVESAAGLRNLNTKYYDYDPAKNIYYEEKSAGIGGANLPMQAAKKASDPLYPTPAKLQVGREILDEGDMTAAVRVKQSREYVSMSVFTATSNTCAVQIGGIATATIPSNFPDVRITDLGAFRVLEVHHKVDKEGHYSNTFKGMAAQSETMPDDHVVIPQAFPEQALVIDNDDPKHQGRVKVRFYWQPADKSTNWIRVQTPDAGKSDVVNKNRGMVFIPEIDDQVMVGFLYGDPSRPYVMGSLFHKDNSEGATTDKNIVRSFITRSGSLLRFTDSEKEKTFRIELRHNAKNGIVLTVKNDDGTMVVETTKDIFVKAPELIQFESKKIVMLAKEYIQAKADDKIEMVADKTVHVESGKEMELLAKNIKQEAKSEFSIKGGRNVKVKAGSTMAIDGGTKLDVKAGTVKMNR
jgi:uncharacterized protein involved in type VI secretion and phage assembly